MLHVVICRGIFEASQIMHAQSVVLAVQLHLAIVYIILAARGLTVITAISDGFS